MGLSAEDVLEILVRRFVYFLGALSRANLAREENGILGYKVLDLILHIIRDFHKDALSFRRKLWVQLELRGALDE